MRAPITQGAGQVRPRLSLSENGVVASPAARFAVVSGLTGTQRILWCLGLLLAFGTWAAGAGGLRVLRSPAASVRAAEVTGRAAPHARSYYGRRLEPREPVVLHGSGPVSEGSFWSYSAALGSSPPMLTSSYVDLHEDLGQFFARLRRDLAQGTPAGPQALLIPEIGLSLGPSLDARGRQVEDRVGAGREDARLQQLVVGLRSLERPVFLRVGYSFNQPLSVSAGGYDPDSYKAAFRHIAAAIHAAGLQQVALVWDWSPDAELDLEEGGAREDDAERRWLAFYPGDDVVDWWGLDLFSEAGITGAATARFLAAADRHGFPVMVGESTPRGHETSEGALLVEGWYRPYFQLIQSTGGIKAFCYLDRNWRAYPQWGSWGDGRVEADPTVLEYARAEMSRTLYAGLRDRTSTESLLGVR